MYAQFCRKLKFKFFSYGKILIQIFSQEENLQQFDTIC